MVKTTPTSVNNIPIGIGYYTVSEAALLLKMPPITIRRWLGGYSYKKNGIERHMEPLWTPNLPPHDGRIELDFRDLIELRFVRELTGLGVGVKFLRAILEGARELANDARPFSTRRFRTDGKTVFLQTLRDPEKSELLDLRSHQYQFGEIVEQSFKDLDLDGDVVARWRPLRGKKSIVIDPARAFGQPIADQAGIPTATLADALKVEGSAKRVSYLYGVAEPVVRDADAFECSLLAA
jgi:uncharacterized protein (DUF433 family)